MPPREIRLKVGSPCRSTGRLGGSGNQGQPHEVNSPGGVTGNGQDASVVNQYGWPATNNVYRGDFVVPDGTAAGMAGIQVSAAWVNGPEVKIPAR